MLDIYKILDAVYDEQENEFNSNTKFEMTDDGEKSIYATIKLNNKHQEEIKKISQGFDEKMNNFLDFEYITTYLGPDVIFSIQQFIHVTSIFNENIWKDQIFDFRLLELRKNTLKELVEELNLFGHIQGEIFDEWKTHFYQK